MFSEDKMRIVHNPKREYPYEVWFGSELVETFVHEDTAKIMCNLQDEMRKLYFRNQHEKLSKK
jgi:hypothetical protein